MWKCFDCGRKLITVNTDGRINCPYCGSTNVSEIFTSLSIDNAFIVNSLVRCGVEWPTIFSLVWGTEESLLKALPNECRRVINDITLEIEKKENCLDLEEKKIHDIVIDLLQVLYEKHINDYVEEAKKKYTFVNKGY